MFVLSCLSSTVDSVDMSLSPSLENVVWHILDLMLDLLCVGELGVDVVTDVLVSALPFVWITVPLGY